MDIAGWEFEQAKIRINASMVPKHVGSLVTVVGMTHGGDPMQSRSVRIETGDKQFLTVNFQEQLTEPLSQYVELLGRVEQDCTLTVLRHINFGNDFDLDTYNEVIQLLPNFPSLFSTN